MFKQLALFALLTFSSLIQAETGGYETLATPQPVQNTGKIEVIEFFWYGCPHCFSFEPALREWLKNKPANVEFIRQPAVFSELWGKHAKIYFTAEVLGVVDKVHGDLFDAVQVKKQKMTSEDEIAKFFVAHGVSDADFKGAYGSFMVDAKSRQAESIAARYGVDGVPALIVNGKYKITGTSAKSQENMINVLNQLIAQESKAK